ncbi:50S ribosomal protein L7ae [Brevibacillus nitrificans]|uniref:50S ribosomal protein L7ae n=1 Tax=Brevibacillus nitrificans TaxID=651560 RepID=A0A3M8DK07_9BACL|nr:50S ribosomal protein L7ae [Brevibacillus nitrificans]RNB88368.1 50S ribosomal protein L7ae [Brevibacillus nitrificans]
MGECKLDHSVEDVQKKLGEQAPFLPEKRAQQLQTLLATELSQERLNELFHLLKKYDLATPEERARREEQMELLLG